MKLPAYGKQLLRERRAGLHPPLVTVIYGGHDWSVEPGCTRVALTPGDALGRDWRCVAGLPIEFHNRSVFRMFENDDGEPLRVLGEIARESAQIVIVENGMRVYADTWAFLMRSPTVPLGAGASRWPAWWSAEIEQIHGQNRKRWTKEASAYLARFAA